MDVDDILDGGLINEGMGPGCVRSSPPGLGKVTPSPGEMGSMVTPFGRWWVRDMQDDVAAY